ncbi:TPA: hypothetical protein CPT96_03235 [Candidatus Gastranaerophilales bacterium HUM_10]|jgi:hypothetical protein|nr:MAG TPA: hypothetical protein CPT96_03235 [Candidatus Gastranaerophilales bacterium HUM_10]
MGKFLTCPARIEQLDEKGKYKVLDNELYKDDDGSIYLVWRGYETDNFTWINSNDWDIRCSHLHDVGCQYHQLVKVRLNIHQLRMLRFVRTKGCKIICEDLPKKFLTIVPITGHEINNMFYRMLKAADCPKTPKYIQYLYRAGVAFNFNWFFTGKENIDLENLYKKNG